MTAATSPTPDAPKGPAGNGKKGRIDIASIRREQIVEAAVAVIAEQGFHNLSLSEIEKKADMSRGQLTYYYPTKESILLGVFDRLLLLMYERMEVTDAPPCAPKSFWGILPPLLDRLFNYPGMNSEFHCLEYTFLSQISHRTDFRTRLARLFEEWRSGMAGSLAVDQSSGQIPSTVSPRTMATLVQAIFHGLAMQQEADPKAFDGPEMVELCLDMLGTYLRVHGRPRAADSKRTESPRHGPVADEDAGTINGADTNPSGNIP